MAKTFVIEVEQIGVSVSRFSNITPSNYSLAYLLGGTDYRFRAKEVDVTSGVTTWSPFSPWFTFTTSAVSDLVVNLGTLSESASLYDLTPEVEVIISEVVTFDVLVDQTSGGSTLTTDIANNYVTLTGLAESEEFTVKARQVTTTGGVKTWSKWSQGVTFSTSMGGGQDLVVNLGHLVETETLFNLTPEIEVPQSSSVIYEIEINEVGIGVTRVGNITETTYPLTGLTGGNDYEIKAREITVLDGVTTWSVWSNTLLFTAEDSVVNDLVVNLGAIAYNVVSLNIITPELSEPQLGDVLINLDSITSEIATLNDVTPRVEGSNTTVATSWSLRVTNLLTNEVTLIPTVNQRTYKITGLTPASLYSYEVKGRSAGIESDWSSPYTFITTLTPYYAESYSSLSGDIDLFYISMNPECLNNSNDLTSFFGEVSDSESTTITLTFDGQTVDIDTFGSDWYVSLIGDRLGISDPDELNRKFGLLMSGDLQNTGNNGFTITGI